MGSLAEPHQGQAGAGQSFWADNSEATAGIAAAALADHPADAGLWEVLGLSLHAMGDVTLAAEALEMATVLRPLSTSAQVALADCYLALDRDEVARSMYQHLAADPDAIPAEHLAAVVAGLTRVGELRAALEVAREHAKRLPRSDDAAFTVVECMEAAECPLVDRLAAARQAYRLAPHRARNRLALAWLHCRSGNLMDAYRLMAATDAERLIAECPRARLQWLVALFTSIGDERRRDALQAAMKEVQEALVPCVS
jgi:tetratricopeptide (TPR) repeat protein